MKNKNKKNKLKRYIILARANPVQAYLDFINLVLIIFVFSIIFYFVTWVEKVFIGTRYANPILINLGGFKIYWYGFLLALATLSGILYTLRKNKKTIKKDHLVALIFWSILGGLIGGRIAFVLSNWEFYSLNSFEIINIKGGGFSFYGALLLGFLSVLIYSLIKKINIKKIIDLFAPAIFLGLTIGSWGSIFNQEKIGKPSHLPLSMYVEPANRPWIYQKFSFFHPIFLYEFFLFLIFFIILVLIKNKKRLPDGSLFALSILFYSLIKFFIGFLISENPSILIFNLTQIVSIIFGVISVISLCILRRKRNEI